MVSHAATTTHSPATDDDCGMDQLLQSSRPPAPATRESAPAASSHGSVAWACVDWKGARQLIVIARVRCNWKGNSEDEQGAKSRDAIHAIRRREGGDTMVSSGDDSSLRAF
nr:unnamed protein product [Digitaria exilis]